MARAASDDEIKKAFRKLARKYHPDVAKDKKSAEAKFKEINEANEVLSDPEKRRRYDQLGADWQNGAGPASAARGPRPAWAGAGGGPNPDVHFDGTGFSDFFESFFGGARRAGGNFSGGFPAGFGGGTAPGRTGFASRGGDIEGDILVTLDEVMRGSMRSLSLRRVDPRTAATETDTFKVRIPPGAQEGRRIRVPGKGEPGSGGAEAGDLFLRVRLAAHPDFRPSGSDLYHDLDLAPWDAVLGREILVPTLAGRIKLRVPAGTNNGQQLRVPGQGLPKGKSGERGDLYIVMNVQFPTQIGAEERELWEKLRSTSSFDPRAT
ncbi:MAG: J domain-containing protein [Opitutaceae bacterium]